MGMPLPSQEFAGSLLRDDLPQTAEAARSVALQLAQERRAIDEEIQSHLSVLQEQGASMTSPLVDSQGFPLATIDIVAVRAARLRIIVLRNDREVISAKMQELLEIALAKRSAPDTVATAEPVRPEVNAAVPSSQAWARLDGRSGILTTLVSTQEGSTQDWAQVGGLQAFARVNSVSEASPAQRANLCPNDEVLRFGDLVFSTAHRDATRKDLGNLPSMVQEGKEVIILVLRQEAGGHKEIKRLRLTPTSGWGGRGLLGCHILPL